MIERIIVSLALIAFLVMAYRAFHEWHRTRATAGRAAAVSAAQPALLYFWSEHCAPCVTQARFLQQLPQQMMRQVKVERIDAEEQQEVAARYGVFTLPTTMLVDRQGCVRHVNYGLTDAHKLASQLESVL